VVDVRKDRDGEPFLNRSSLARRDEEAQIRQPTMAIFCSKTYAFYETVQRLFLLLGEKVRMRADVQTK